MLKNLLGSHSLKALADHLDQQYKTSVQEIEAIEDRKLREFSFAIMAEFSRIILRSIQAAQATGISNEEAHRATMAAIRSLLLYEEKSVETHQFLMALKKQGEAHDA